MSTEEKIQRDIQTHTNFFLALLRREMNYLKEKITNDWRLPKPGWEGTYEDLIKLIRARNRDPTRLQAAVERAKAAFDDLSYIADDEINEQFLAKVSALRTLENASLSPSESTQANDSSI